MEKLEPYSRRKSHVCNHVWDLGACIYCKKPRLLKSLIEPYERNPNLERPKCR